MLRPTRLRLAACILFSAALLASLASLPACGGEGQEIRIGLQGPMTGDYAYEGAGFRRGVGLLVEQTNAAGGILGRPVKLLVEDDAGDPTQSALVAQRLVDAGVVAVVGAYNSTATEPASQIYNEAGVLHITPSSTAVRLSQKGFPRFFRVCFVDDRQGLFAARFMVEVLGARRIGILHDNSTYAQGLGEEARRAAAQLGAEIAFYDAINPTDKDFAPILTRIGAAGLETVLFTGYHSQCGLLLKQARALGLELPWVAGDACNNPVMIEIAGAANARGHYVVTEPLPKDLDYPEARRFIADYTARYGEAPASAWTIMAAEAFHVIRHAMETTQSTDPGVLADYLHDALRDLNGLTGPIEGFDERGDRLGTVHLAYVIDEHGQFQVHPRQPDH
ncbi:MAG: branched-chain amino acid ABC transporter substrate-binding protein [Candidatus Eisenbacteria bacterium]|uniref:Branched-chain amino acid ABC transporter substrate-binding protein n=1 Tax=Eiseniibacteriota bacterium TaxID=2212470 RepID=A0A938BKS6_UNCEI|nr:branched-chain amino acid ABC transporter substrate-binding protein [Candidatus Eisenbacteria bacterium]